MRDQRTTLMRTLRQRSMTSEGVGSASSGFLQGLQLLTPSSVYFGRHSHAPAVPGLLRDTEGSAFALSFCGAGLGFYRNWKK